MKDFDEYYGRLVGQCW